jgi:hypothetical protein
VEFSFLLHLTLGFESFTLPVLEPHVRIYYILSLVYITFVYFKINNAERFYTSPVSNLSIPFKIGNTMIKFYVSILVFS